MNSMKFFNFRYLLENFKKSKTFIAFVLLILPILNVISLLMMNTTTIRVMGLNDISSLTIFGLFVIPIIMTFTLFGYVFKKKSVDFIGSMPLSRKTIFLTNSIGGIMVLVLLTFLNAALLYITGLFLPNIVLSYKVVIDYFILFATSYIFVFTASNIAVSVSGNLMTSLIVTTLILFLIPFMDTYLKAIDFSGSSNKLIYDCPTCNYLEAEYKDTSFTLSPKENYERGVEKVTNFGSYTAPYNMIFSSIKQERNIYQTTRILPMLGLSIVYIGVGFILFKRKEMEVSETSFKTFKSHVFVKFLTFIPIISIINILVADMEGFAGYAFIFIILIIYNFVYDLITKKQITEILKNGIVFLITISIIMLFTNLVNKALWHDEDITFKRNDIDSVQLRTGREYKEVTDNKVIDIVLKGMYDESWTEKDGTSSGIRIKVKGKLYESFITLTDTDQEIIDKYLLSQGSTEKITTDNNFVVTGEDYIYLDKKEIHTLSEALKKNSKTANGIELIIYKYIDHQYQTYSVYSGIDDTLNKSVINKYNNKLLNYRDTHDITKNNGYLQVYSMNQNSDFQGYLNIGTNDYIKSLSKNNIDFNSTLYKITYYTSDGEFYFIKNLSDDEKTKFSK